MSDDFVECDTCRAKPGTPPLCAGCLHNRRLIGWLRAALKPFSELADTWTVQTAAKDNAMLTVSNGQRMCGISAEAFIQAKKALEGEEAR